MKKLLSLLALTILFSITTFADIKAPTTPKPTEAPKETVKEGEMVIMMTYKVDEPVLVIKKEMFEKLRAAYDGKQISSSEGLDFNKTQTIVSGLFLSLAFVFGGVWLARNRGKVSKSTVGIVVFALVGMMATFVTANARAPRNVGFSRAVLSQELSVENSYAEGKVKVLIGDGVSGNDIELLFPKRTSDETIKNKE